LYFVYGKGLSKQPEKIKNRQNSALFADFGGFCLLFQRENCKKPRSLSRSPPRSLGKRFPKKTIPIKNTT
ncbi:MAG: hypothetical protein IKZ07_05595, partial [Akkermansia sp.]|nr:hypothetical protein [Akkermansia sp.]